MGSTLTFAHFTVVNMIFGFQRQLRGDILKLYPHPRQRHDFFLYIVFQPRFFFTFFNTCGHSSYTFLKLWCHLGHFPMFCLFLDKRFTLFSFSVQFFLVFPLFIYFPKRTFSTFSLFVDTDFTLFPTLFFFLFLNTCFTPLSPFLTVFQPSFFTLSPLWTRILHV